jgi:hypothetical protein
MSAFEMQHLRNSGSWSQLSFLPCGTQQRGQANSQEHRNKLPSFVLIKRTPSTFLSNSVNAFGLSHGSSVQVGEHHTMSSLNIIGRDPNTIPPYLVSIAGVLTPLQPEQSRCGPAQHPAMRVSPAHDERPR